MTKLGKEMHDLANVLFPICRSLTGEGVRETLKIISRKIPIKINEVPTGTKVFDWSVPKEWNIRDAYIITPDGEKICEFKKKNLHVLGYSTPINKLISLNELQDHLYSIPNQPDAIPYVTSYYDERWGFCISHKDRLKLVDGVYHVFIDSYLEDGSLTYGELIIPGETNKEVFLSTYVCHPSMANNELSGPVVTIALAKFIKALKNRRYTYRIIFIPETIGSIVYLNKNLYHLKEHVDAGFNITCIGDERCYSYLPSRHGNTLSDKVALHVLKHTDRNFKSYTWLDRGSDERQYCAPGVDLPIATIMRSKYGEYPEYHTSLDDLCLVTPSGLEGGYKALKKAIEIIEKNTYPRINVLGEPQLGKRGLYPTLSTKKSGVKVRKMMDFISFCDGKHSLLEIAELINTPFHDLLEIMEKLVEKRLMSVTVDEE